MLVEQISGAHDICRHFGFSREEQFRVLFSGLDLIKVSVGLQTLVATKQSRIVYNNNDNLITTKLIYK